MARPSPGSARIANSRVALSNVEQAYDYLGRPLPIATDVELTRETKASPVVLQLVGAGDSAKSAFRLNDAKELQLVAYNFGTKPVSGKLHVEGASINNAHIAIAPGARVERTMTAAGPGRVTATLEAGKLGTAVVAGNVIGT